MLITNPEVHSTLMDKKRKDLRNFWTVKRKKLTISKGKEKTKRWKSNAKRTERMQKRSKRNLKKAKQRQHSKTQRKQQLLKQIHLQLLAREMLLLKEITELSLL